MDAEYLKEHVGTLLSEALTATVIASPVDGVTYIAEWLIHNLQTKQRLASKQAQLTQQLKQDDEFEVKSAAAAAAAEAAKTEAASAKQSLHAAMQTVLGTEYTDNITCVQAFINALQPLVPHCSVYVGHADSADSIKFIASTSDCAETVLQQRMTKPNGVLFDILSEEEKTDGDENADADADSAAKTSAAEKPLKTLYIPSTVIGPVASRLNWFGAKSAGAYHCTRLHVDALLDENAISEWFEKEKELAQKFAAPLPETEAATENAEEADAPADGEEEDEEAVAARQARKAAAEAKAARIALLASETPEEREARETAEAAQRSANLTAAVTVAVTKKSSDYLLCVDTIRSAAHITDDDQSIIRQYATALQSALTDCDRRISATERQRRVQYREAQKESKESAGDEAEQNDEQKAAVTKAERTAAQQALAATSPAYKITNEDISYAVATGQLIKQWPMIQSISEWAIVSTVTLDALVAVMNTVGINRATLTDKVDQSDWLLTRAVLASQQSPSVAERIASFQPRQSFAIADWRNTLTFINNRISSITSEQIAAANIVGTSELIEWLNAVRKLRKRSRVEAKAARKAAFEAAEAEKERLEREREAAEDAAAAAAENNGAEADADAENEETE